LDEFTGAFLGGLVMAELSLVVGYAHTPYLFGPPGMWPQIRDRIRKGKPVSDELPRETEVELEDKYERSMNAFSILCGWIESARPDALIVVGDDQKEMFTDYVIPFTVYVGQDVAGKRLPGRVREVTGNQEMIHVPNHVELARELVNRLLHSGFDVGCFSEIADKPDGFGHAFEPPLDYLTPRLDIPVVPIMVNCYYAPQPAARRCYQFGAALGAALSEIESAQRVAVAVSGGLWHTPGSEDATIDEAFDRELLRCLGAGQGNRLAELPDQLLVSGTGEIRNWIVGAGMTGRTQWEVLDYVPLYYSPIGMGFAGCRLSTP
jgi:hypothetical protein